ncbi:hypothetical protein [Streptomyces virginiae]|uniref:hypothetical protein n=1 Tax=Streptomyces virginiae TaxID=1961 RepID=UPI0036FB9333
MPTKPRLPGRGHVPVAVYSCATDPAERSGGEALGRRYAEARFWKVATVRSDVDPATPLDNRAGWAAILTALISGNVSGVVVAGESRAAEGGRVMHQPGAAVRGYGGFLAEAVAIDLRQTDEGETHGGGQ